MQDLWTAAPPLGIRATKSAPCSPMKPLTISRSDSFHVAHKVPIGDTPYVRAKQVQLVDKDPEKAIALFWAAINAGDRVDSALKDMAIVMKQQNRAEEAIEAIKSLRNRCSDQAQESLDNILLDLYKRCGRLDDQIALLKHKLFLIQQGLAFNGKRTKTARSQGKKFQVSVEQEATRLLGNLGWALMQQQNYTEAEASYRRALLIAADNNKMCNLGICLMKQGRIAEAKETLRQVRPAMADGPRGVDSHLKAYERAQEMLRDLESEKMNEGQDVFKQSQLFDVYLGSSSIWQPQPCADPFVSSTTLKVRDGYGDENLDLNRAARVTVIQDSKAPLSSSQKPAVPPGFCARVPSPAKLQEGLGDENGVNRAQGHQMPLQKASNWIIAPRNPLNCDARPFYSKLSRDSIHTQLHDPLGNLKRTRSGNMALPAKEQGAESSIIIQRNALRAEAPEAKPRRRSLSLEETSEKLLDLLPDSKEFDEALVAAILEPFQGAVGAEKTVQKKRFKVLQDITLSLSPRA